MALIYRIVPRAAWQQAQSQGGFSGSAHDLRDGFIHFSAAHQLLETARKHYAGQPDLLLLTIDAQRLDRTLPGALRWEPSRGGDLFPHLYAELPVGAVARVQELPLGPDGAHQFPQLEA